MLTLVIRRAEEVPYPVRPSAARLDVSVEGTAVQPGLPWAVQLLAERSHPETGTSTLVTMYVGPWLQTRLTVYPKPAYSQCF